MPRIFQNERRLAIESTGKRAGFGMMNDAVCTIVTKRYLPSARLLYHSLAKNDPGIDFYLFLADRPDGCFDPAAEPFKVVALDQLADQKTIGEMSFYWSPVELCCALRGLVHQYMWEKSAAQRWLYLDSDLLLTGSLKPLFEMLQASAILLSPHLLHPPEPTVALAWEPTLLARGVYNGGCQGLSRRPQTRAFIDWFSTRLARYSFDFARGYYLDQLWLNLVPTLFQDVSICRHGGANVAYWNHFERNVTLSDDGSLHCGEEPLLFWHFSGWNMSQPACLSQHTPDGLRPGERANPAIRRLMETYRLGLIEHGYEQSKDWPYSFSKFDNGRPIEPRMRLRYYDMLCAGSWPGGSAFARADLFPASPPPTLVRRVARRLLSKRLRAKLIQAMTSPTN